MKCTVRRWRRGSAEHRHVVICRLRVVDCGLVFSGRLQRHARPSRTSPWPRRALGRQQVERAALVVGSPPAPVGEPGEERSELGGADARVAHLRPPAWVVRALRSPRSRSRRRAGPSRRACVRGRSDVRQEHRVRELAQLRRHARLLFEDVEAGRRQMSGPERPDQRIVSTSAPLLALTRIAPGFMSASVSASIRWRVSASAAVQSDEVRRASSSGSSRALRCRPGPPRCGWCRARGRRTPGGARPRAGRSARSRRSRRSRRQPATEEVARATATADDRVALGDPARRRQHQGDGQLRGRVGEDSGRVRGPHAVGSDGGQIDVVEPTPKFATTASDPAGGRATSSTPDSGRVYVPAMPGTRCRQGLARPLVGDLNRVALPEQIDARLRGRSQPRRRGAYPLPGHDLRRGRLRGSSEPGDDGAPRRGYCRIPSLRSPATCRGTAPRPRQGDRHGSCHTPAAR